MLDRLHPKKDYCSFFSATNSLSDCYGIDMARLEHLIAFNAALELHKDRNTYEIVETIYKKCKASLRPKCRITRF